MTLLRVALLGFLVLPAGCSRGPAAIPPPEVDPESAADQAIELFDANHDGALSKEELAKCPGVLGKFAAYDQNSSGAVERDEVAARVAELLKANIALTRLQCHVTFRGRPLSGASVTFEPESRSRPPRESPTNTGPHQ